MLDARNTSPELENSIIEMAILPVGAIEQHGAHLPIMTDWKQAEALAAGIAEQLGAFLLPGLPYGNSEAHAGFRGSITIRPETLRDMVADVVRSLWSQDVSKVVIVNTHGGNRILGLAVRALNMSPSQGRVILIHPLQLARAKLRQIIESIDEEQHAGELETSLMLYLTPQLVRENRVDHVPDVSPEYFDYAPMRLYCPEGVWGRSSLATTERGRRAFEVMIEETVRHIQDTFWKLDQMSHESTDSTATIKGEN